MITTAVAVPTQSPGPLDKSTTVADVKGVVNLDNKVKDPTPTTNPTRRLKPIPAPTPFVDPLDFYIEHGLNGYGWWPWG